MSEILTEEERKTWREGAAYILASPGHYKVGLERLAACILAYEATLQARDEQIAALMTALKGIAAIVPADPRRNQAEIMRHIAEAAIKEATNAT